jgi:hypothetical protein
MKIALTRLLALAAIAALAQASMALVAPCMADVVLVQSEPDPEVDCEKAKVCIPQCRVEASEKCKGNARGGCLPDAY